LAAPEETRQHLEEVARAAEAEAMQAGSKNEGRLSMLEQHRKKMERRRRRRRRRRKKEKEKEKEKEKGEGGKGGAGEKAEWRMWGPRTGFGDSSQEHAMD